MTTQEEAMDKYWGSHYKSRMRIPYVYSAAAATFAIVVTVDVVIQHVALAQETPAATAPKPEPSRPPVVFARFAKADASVGLQPLEDTLHCQGDAFFSDVDVCGPVPHLTSEKGTASLNPPKWLLPKTPLSFIWQQPTKPGNRLAVELIDSNGRPVNATSKSFKKSDRESVEITPSVSANGKELHLVGNIYAADDKRLEHWVLPITFK